MSTKKVEEEMDKLLSYQEFFRNSAKITRNWGIGLRNRPARACQGEELATELLRKIADFERFLSSAFWNEEGITIKINSLFPI